MESVDKIREELNANILRGISIGDTSLIEVSIEKYKQYSGKEYETQEKSNDDALHTETIFFGRDEPFYLGIDYLMQYYLEKNKRLYYQFCDYCVDFFHKEIDSEGKYKFHYRDRLLFDLPSEKSKAIVDKCFYIKGEKLWGLGKQQESIDVLELGATYFKSPLCALGTGMCYANYNDEQSLNKACYYLEMYDWKDENERSRARETRQRLIACRAAEVEATMRTLAEDWLVPPSNSSITWEEYSNIKDCINQLRRKTITPMKHVFGTCVDYKGNRFVNMEYKPGQIDLAHLWSYYWFAHIKSTRKFLFFKKLKYIGNIYEGDFVDCVKFLWVQKYRDQETNPHTTLFEDSKEIEIPVQQTKERIDLSSLEEKKVGVIAQEDLRPCLEAGTLGEDELFCLQQKEYCKTTFNLNFPLLVKSDGVYDSVRYYSKSIMVRGVEYKLCSQWYESNKPYLINWIRMHS